MDGMLPEVWRTLLDKPAVAPGVGGHLTKGDPNLGRPDASDLAKEYLNNCGRPYKIQDGRPVPIDK